VYKNKSDDWRQMIGKPIIISREW